MAKIVQLTRIESGTWAFQRANNQGRASFLTSPKWYSDDQICRFFTEISTKPKHYKYATISFIFSKNFQRQGCAMRAHAYVWRPIALCHTALLLAPI